MEKSQREKLQRFSIRKLSIGAVSCLIGTVTFLGYSHDVQAAEKPQTVETAKAANEIQPEKAQESKPTEEAKGDTQNAAVNKNAVESQKTGAVTTVNQVSTKENVPATKENVPAANEASKANETSKANDASKANEAAATNTLNIKAATDKAGINTTSAVKANTASISTNKTANVASTKTKENETGSAATNASKVNTVSKETKSNIADSAISTKIKLQAIKLAKPVATKTLAESKVATDNQFNFDDWTTQIDDNYLNITGYEGDRSKQIIVPNGADFAKAGKNDKNLQVEIDKDTLAGLIVNGVAPKLSNTDGQKIVAKGNDWHSAFYDKGLHDISGLANLDTSSVTDMSYMFNSNLNSNQISDLSPLANWNTGNVTDMGNMFRTNRISDLSPLAHWNTDNVTDMYGMLAENHISDLSPLANWNIGNVTSMGDMLANNQIRDLSPLANWNTGNVTDMNTMFNGNQISDLSPLAKWNTSNVDRMYNMFFGNQISDLSPLANWNIGNVWDMSKMFGYNQISDLSPLANWNTSDVHNMRSMFDHNQIRDLSPLANWNTDNVNNMNGMFNHNPLNPTINSQSTLNKFDTIPYKLDNIGALASHNESKTFNDGSQILLDKNVVTAKDSATLTFKANSLAGNTYQIKIYNPDNFTFNIQAAALPTALGTTDTSYQDGYTIITNKFINNGSVSQDISIAHNSYIHDVPDFAQYESTSGLITVAKDEENLGSINITYQSVSNISNDISAPYIGDKPYVNHTQNTFYFQPCINSDQPNEQYSFIKSAGLTITVPDNVTIDPDTFIDAKSGKTLKGAKIADNQYQVVLGNTTDGITVKGLINVPADKLTNGTVHLPGFGTKYTVTTYNDKVAPLVATDTSKELSVIPDLASYHGDLIKINQSKWAFDRNGNKVNNYDYYSQGFTNRFNGIPLEPAVSTQVTNGVETFDMPAGVNITDFEPPFNDNVIDHIDCIHTDGSKETFGFLHGSPNAIRQIKIYFKNGIQSDELFGWNSNFDLSFDAAYPNGTPIKNFDTFKITGSFSCDELGSVDNIDVAQVMLAPTQELPDGMMTETDKNEANKTANASGNFINAIILNNGLQHQGHLTNPVFYFKYNNLMVPDLSEISASYDNQNKNLGSIGLTDIDKDKIHSSIITDDAGQKFIKVQVDGEYYYGGSSDHISDFSVHVPIINASDALTATKDWSWYVLNNSDEAKTESTIQNRSQVDKPLPVTVDGNTLSVGETDTWQIITAQGFTSGTETQGNLNGGPSLVSTQDDHRQDPTHFILYDSIINATNDAKSDLVSVTNLPSTQDGKSQFNVHMTGKASLINVMTGQTYDAAITYSYGMGDNNFITGDQVTDWSKVKSIKVVPNGGAPSMTSLRLVVPVEDKTVYDDVGKTIYMSTMTYGEDKANTNYTTKDGFAVPEKSTILPIIIKAGDKASAKLTVQGQATVHTLIHYKDANGKDVYVKLADQDKTYNELQDTMKRSDYLQSDSDLTIADRGLLPVGMIINYNNPTIRNSNNTYVAGYANNVAAFDKIAKYDFDGDQVIFEGAMPEIVTKTHQAKETIHYVYRDGRTAAPDKVLTSIILKQTGSKNPFTNEITWNTSMADTLNSVDSPEITGYIADKLTVPSYVVTMTSPDKDVTVTYDADNENADFTYFDDTKNSTLKVVPKSGKSNTSIGYTTTDDINNYEKQGYTLVSDDTDGRDLNFDSLPTIDQHYTIHLKHKTESVTRNDTVTRTIHYLYDNGNTAQPDKTQTVSFNEAGTKDDVTGKTTWYNDNAQTVDSVNTPSITGYTPDKSSIEGKSFNFGDQDVEVTVTYHANAQTAKITYIDDTTKNTLDSKDANGKFGQTITFATAPSDEIANYKKQGYVLVSNSFNNQTYAADNNNNVFYVHLKHNIENVTRNDTVTRTIHYLYDNGNTAQPDKTQTVSFNETGTKDDVTNKTTWSNDNAQTVDSVNTPNITGYTPDKSSIEGQSFKFGDQDVEVTVTYNANAQTATITYIDDTDKKTLGSDSQNGKFNQAITFEHDPAAEIANYKKQGYVLVSNSFDNNKYQADNNNNVFYVHFIHGTKKVSRNDDVNMTVHYVMDDDSQAPSDNKQTVNFTENGIQDLVTQKITWTPADSQTLNDVVSPVLTGYTADIKTANGKAVNFGDNDINVTVHYSANAQTAKITYIDDTTKNTLDSKDASGKFGQAITFATAPTDEIANYKKQGYVLVSNSFDNNKYQADNNNNVFYVHLIHGTKKVNRNDDVNMTVHYVMDDNSEAPSDNKQTVNFTEDGTQDLVTQKITWTPADSQTLNDVASPVLTGYTADIKTANGKAVNFGDSDINVTVTYHANAQTAKITYIDDTTKNTLDSKDASGKFGQAIAFATAPSDEIANYKKQGYVLVSNSFDNNKYQADDNNNVFYVHLKHNIENVTRNDTVTRTIHYIYDNGETAQPDKTQTVFFNETGTKDDVTNKTTWSNDNAQSVDRVNTPSITGYTPDKSSIEKQSFKFGDQDVEVIVTYNPDQQKAKVLFIDDTAKTTLDTHNLTGVTNGHESYNPSAEINQFINKHYVFVSSNYPDDGFTYDNDDGKDQVFEIHLKHGIHDISDKKAITETITYKMSDDSKAPDKVEKQVEFDRDGYNDEVTKQDHWNKWQPNKQTFDTVPTPEVKGYTPDIKSVEAKTVTSGDKDITVTVTYNPDQQKAKVVFIDDTTKNTLDTHNLTGVTNGHESYSPSEEINQFVDKHYVLVSSDYPEKGFTYDNDDSKDQVFEIHLKHGTHKITDKRTVTETITYRTSDGSKTPDKVEKQIEFNRDGYNDEVTKQDHWNKWQPNKQTFDVVPTPDVKGYTPDIKSVETKTVTSGDKDITETVTYTPDQQKAKVLFIDDTAKTTLDTHNLTGVTNGHESYSPSAEIGEFVGKHYVLVSSDYPDNGFTYDNDDSKDQVFEIHFKERPTESGTSTIPDETKGDGGSGDTSTDNGGSNDTSTDSDNPEKDNGGSDTVDKSSRKTPVKRNDNKKHPGTKKTNIPKNANKNYQSTKKTNIPKTSNTVKLNSNRLAQPKLEKVQESTNRVNRIKHDALPQTGEKHNSLMAMLGLAISGLGMIGAIKSKKRKDD